VSSVECRVDSAKYSNSNSNSNNTGKGCYSCQRRWRLLLGVQHGASNAVSKEEEEEDEEVEVEWTAAAAIGAI